MAKKNYDGGRDMKVYKAISQVIRAMSKDGISKERRNQQQGFMFRGIDDVYNALAPHLAESGLVIIPRMVSRECVERAAKSGGSLFCVTVEAEFDFVSAEDGSKHTAKTYGEAMDSADKATNKAMSAAFKYAAFQTFCIPTEGDNDADTSTPLVSPRPQPAPQTAPQRQAPTQDTRKPSDKQLSYLKMLAEKAGQPMPTVFTMAEVDAAIKKLSAR